jgi:hypothetical protein
VSAEEGHQATLVARAGLFQTESHSKRKTMKRTENGLDASMWSAAFYPILLEGGGNRFAS